MTKLCEHEWWHAALDGEVRWWINGGLQEPDDDWDWLSNTWEAELGTDPNKKDTYGLSSYDPPDYSVYANYADQELFCRRKEINVKGDASKDWSSGGVQYPKPGN